MSSTRRTALVLLVLALLAGTTFLPTALAQFKKLPPVPVPADPANPPGKEPAKDDPNEFSHDVNLPVDNRLAGKVQAAEDYIRDKDWQEAVRILQSLLDRKEDVFVQVARKDAKGQETRAWVSVRAEADRLLSGLPSDGLEFYKLRYGGDAKKLLDEANEKSDAEMLAQVAKRYLYTDAGAEALDLLGTWNLDRGKNIAAARCFDRLIKRENGEKLSAKTLLKAALAFQSIGDKTAEEFTWKLLEQQHGSSVKLGERTVSLTYIKDEAAKTFKLASRESSLYDLGGYRGGPSRNALAVGGTPFLEKRWYLSAYHDSKATNPAKGLVDQAVRQAESRQQVVMPTFFPIASDGKLIYRSFWGIHAINLKNGKLEWEAESKLSLERIFTAKLGQGELMRSVQTWASQYIQFNKGNVLYENSLLGTLSTDNTLVYTIDDVAVPPWAQFNPYNGFPGGQVPHFTGELGKILSHSKLQAYELKSGKLKWEVPGNGEKDELADTYFLGAPLPMYGKLYALTEKSQELRLVCLDSADGKVSWSQKLAEAKNPLMKDVSRRPHAAHLAYGEGILVCPTNAGALLGVDLLSQSLVWAHSYRDKGRTDDMDQMELWRRGMIPQPNMMHNQSEWKNTAPIVLDGKVIFAAPDSSAVHCLNLRDGTLLWKANRNEDDLFLAGVFKNKVVVVGKKSVRAHNLADGKLAWQLDTGLPSGQGVCADNIYYLPLRTAVATKEPEVCAIDIEKGLIHAHTRSRKKEVPGNLLFYEGDVISQSLTEVAAFPQLKIKLAEIDKRLGDDSKDPVGRVERAEYRLDKGDLEGAVDDLRVALNNKPEKELEAKARGRLHETITEFLQRDFGKAEKYLPEYKALCTVPGDAAETQKRTANYLCLLGKGRESQGKLVEAFEAYIEYGTIGDTKELNSVIDEPAVKSPADVWAQGRIAAMMARAKPEDRAPLEKKISEKWAEVQKSTDPEALRRFVALFGAGFKVGGEARLALAEQLMAQSGNGSLLEAERQLALLQSQENDPQLAARAVEALARLMARKGFLEDAAHWYRVLGRDYAKVMVRDGKTGEDFYNDLATDKRFIPYLDEPGQVWGGRMKATAKDSINNQNRQVFTFEPAGEVLPFFQRHRVALELNFHQFKLIDRATNADTWSINLTRTTFQNFLWNGMPNNQPRFPYHTVGHMVVLNLGHIIFGLDPVNKTKLWEENLLGNQSAVNNNIIQDPKDGALIMVFPDGFQKRIGAVGPIGPSYVSMLTQDGLVAVDPLSGRKLWTRADVTTKAHLFGDNDHIYVVDMNNDGNPTSTRCFRAHDGVSVPDVPDFTTVYTQRQKIMGRRLLTSETAKGKTVLRVYDVQTGKDDWKKEFAANSTLVHSEVPNLVGVIEPEGKATVVDLNTQKEVLVANLRKQDLEKVTGVTLLQDRQFTYFAINGPMDPNQAPWGGVQSNLQQGSGLRSVPVNGQVYAFDRETQKLKWRADALNQHLVLDQFSDLPVLMFTSRYTQMQGAGANRFAMQVVALMSVEKRTGKVLYNRPGPDGKDPLSQNVNYFFALNTDLRGGKIELVGYNFKFTHELDTEK